MEIRKTVRELLQYFREGENCSCPYLIEEDGVRKLCIFTYFTSGENPLHVYGYGRVISSDGNSVSLHQRELFQTEEEIITINDNNRMSASERDHLYDEYYQALQDFVDEQAETSMMKDAVRQSFCRIIKGGAIELYRRICPEFLYEFSI